MNLVTTLYTSIDVYHYKEPWHQFQFLESSRLRGSPKIKVTTVYDRGGEIKILIKKREKRQALHLNPQCLSLYSTQMLHFFFFFGLFKNWGITYI